MDKNYIYLIYIMNLQQQQQRLTSPLIFRLSNLSDKRSSLVRIAIFEQLLSYLLQNHPYLVAFRVAFVSNLSKFPFVTLCTSHIPN